MAALAVAFAGCGGSENGAVKKTAIDFYTALSAGDGARACALLTPREGQSGAGGGVSGTASCANGLGAIGRGFPPATFEKASVHGSTATATLRTQTAPPIHLPLVKVDGKWRVDR